MIYDLDFKASHRQAGSLVSFSKGKMPSLEMDRQKPSAAIDEEPLTGKLKAAEP